MSRACRILIVLAAIMGADGVMLAAASAHQADASRLASASSMLLIHASAVLSGVAFAERGLSVAGIVIGASMRPRSAQAPAGRPALAGNSSIDEAEASRDAS